jgi:acyl carrier protein
VNSDPTVCTLRRILASLDGCFLEAERILPEHRLREDIGLDSLAMIDLLVAIEEEFHIYLDPLEVDLYSAFETVGSLTVLVEHLLEGS